MLDTDTASEAPPLCSGHVLKHCELSTIVDRGAADITAALTRLPYRKSQR
jgi:hypothetical protein